MQNNASFTKSSKFLLICIYLLMAGPLISCASSPPSRTLPQSKVAVSSVDHSNYRKHVSNDVDEAKNKLQQALELEANNQHGSAEHLAQQIIADVELIKIKTQRLNVELEVKQVESSISNLHEELKWREPIQLTPLNQ